MKNSDLGTAIADTMNAEFDEIKARELSALNDRIVETKLLLAALRRRRDELKAGRMFAPVTDQVERIEIENARVESSGQSNAESWACRCGEVVSIEHDRCHECGKKPPRPIRQLLDGRRRRRLDDSHRRQLGQIDASFQRRLEEDATDPGPDYVE